MTALAIIAMLAWLYLVLLHGRFWQSGPSLAPARPIDAPAVAIIVPARDEAELVAASIGSLLAQDYGGDFCVVLVDDGSSDGTAAIARALPDPAGRLSVVAAPPRPPGWAGKLWAVHQGITATDARTLLLTDADIVHDPQHLATLVAQMERGGAELVSEMVALNCETVAERAVLPGFVYFFALLYPFSWVNDRGRGTAAAAGGTVLIRRSALERIGGIAAIRGALIDDVSLARAVKPGGAIWLGHGGLARSIRRSADFSTLWRMVARCAYVQLGYSPALLLGTVLVLGLVFLVPPVAALAWGSPFGLLAWALMAGSFVPSLRRFGVSPLWAPLLPAVAAFYMAATFGAAIDHHRGRGVVWKSRAYGEGSA